jgi:hypothetical protein
MDADETALHTWERKLLILAFGSWAAVVAAYGQMAVNRIDRIVEQMERQFNLNSEAHAILDRRLTIVEQRQEGVLRALAKIDAHIEDELRGEHP